MSRQDIEKLLLEIRPGENAIDEIRAIERTDEFDRIDEAEL